MSWESTALDIFWKTPSLLPSPEMIEYILIVWAKAYPALHLDFSPEHTSLIVNFLMFASFEIWRSQELLKSPSVGSFLLNSFFLNLSLSFYVLLSRKKIAGCISSTSLGNLFSNIFNFIIYSLFSPQLQNTMQPSFMPLYNNSSSFI